MIASAADKSAARGFSLIEVIVIIAIISLLMAILLPALSSAREQSRRAVCASNVGQITKAFTMLLIDTKGEFPRGVNMQHNYGGRQGNGSLAFGSNSKAPRPKPLNSYLHLQKVLRTQGEVFACPSDKGVGSARPTALAYYGNSYRTNELVVGENQVRAPTDDPCEAQCQFWTRLNEQLADMKESSVDNPSRLLLVGEATWWWNYTQAWPDDFSTWHRAACRHNVGFLDGHVDFVRIRKGVHSCATYTLIPFRNLSELCPDCQQEIPCH